MDKFETTMLLIVSAFIGFLIVLVVKSFTPQDPNNMHAPQYLSEYGLTRYENHEVICYRANGYEGFACKWKEMPAGSYCKLPTNKGE